MNVMYTCDNNYVWLMGISVISLFENNKDANDLIVYLLGENISQENKRKLDEIGNEYGRTIKVIDVPKVEIPASLVSSRWPLSAFTRLFCGQILPLDVDKILYLDCDTIVANDITEIDKIKFESNIAYGVKDCISGSYKKNIGLDKDSPYFNAGVILFNVNALRKVDMNAVIDAYVKEHIKLINYADQDIFNGIFKGRIGVLNLKYNLITIDAVYTYEEIQNLRRPTNFYSKAEIDAAKKNPAIIHYTTNMLVVRPWYSNSNHPFKAYFHRYMDMSLWKNKMLGTMTFTSKESKVINNIMKLPPEISYRILGLIHAELKPKCVKMKALNYHGGKL